MSLTKAQKDKYIEQGGVKCPYCGHENIEGDMVEVDAGTAWHEIWCLECKEGWTDLYTLTGIKED